MQLIRNPVKLELVSMREIIELDIWILCNLVKYYKLEKSLF
jgi:hypothetical protein